jgi:hypothetical protein
MDQRDDLRATELHNLRLALAMFALHLDAFEMRTRGGLTRTGIETGIATPAPAAGRPQKEKIVGRQ